MKNNLTVKLQSGTNLKSRKNYVQLHNNVAKQKSIQNKSSICFPDSFISNPNDFDDYQTSPKPIKPVYHKKTIKSSQKNRNNVNNMRIQSKSESLKKYKLSHKKVKHNIQSKQEQPNYDRRYQQLVQICNKINNKPNNTLKNTNKKHIINICKDGLKQKRRHQINIINRNSQKNKITKSMTKINCKGSSEHLYDFLYCNQDMREMKSARNRQLNHSSIETLSQKRKQASKSCRSFHYDLNLPQIIQNLQGEMTQQGSQQNIQKTDKNQISTQRTQKQSSRTQKHKVSTIQNTNSKTLLNADEMNQFLDQSVTPFSCQFLYDSSKLAELQTNCYPQVINSYYYGQSHHREVKQQKKIDVIKLVTKERRIKSSNSNYNGNKQNTHQQGTRKRKDMLSNALKNKLKISKRFQG